MAATDATTIPEDLVIAAYGEDVPCAMELTPEGCIKRAKFLITFKHIDGTVSCFKPEKVPVCLEHRTQVSRAFEGFWAEVVGGPPPCGDCGKVLRIDAVTPINAAP